MKQENEHYEKQIAYNDEAVPVRFITQERGKYHNIPHWQRNPGAWSRHRKQLFINTLLHNGFVPALVLYPDASDPEKLWILDGQQRLTTILDYIDGRFTTGHRQSLQKYLEPHRFFSELTENAQKRILNFRVRYSVLQETDQARLQAIYISLQNQAPLKAAEILYVSDTKARKATLQIMEHPYFSEIYSGNIKRYELFHMASYPLTLELYGPVVNLDHHKLTHVLQSGEWDYAITTALIERIEENLLHIMHLFKDTRTKSIVSIIAQYQAIQFLQACNYDLNAAKEGCLTEWFDAINPSSTGYGRFSVFSQMFRFSYQHVFWQQHLADIALLVGKENGNFEDITRIVSWLHNRHICPACKEAVALKDIKQHGFKLDDALDCRSQPHLTVQQNGHATQTNTSILTPVSVVGSEKL